MTLVMVLVWPTLEPHGPVVLTGSNWAVTDLSALIATVHVLDVPEQSPDHPPKVEPEAGVSVSVTEVPSLKDAEHVEPQLIPEGLEVTVPDPVPVLLTERMCVTTGLGLKLATTE